MFRSYLFQSEMFDITPELNYIDKSIRANRVKDIVTQKKKTLIFILIRCNGFT